jgi:hypothetical protein
VVNPPPPATDQFLRGAKIADVEPIRALLSEYAQKGNLLPRTREDIAKHLREFVVYEKGGEIASSVTNSNTATKLRWCCRSRSTRLPPRLAAL